MKQLFAFAAVALVCAACTSDPDNSMESVTNEQQRVTLSFAPSVTTEPMGAKALTRAAVPVSDVVNRLDIWLFEGDPAKALTQTAPVAESHQAKGDDGFGSLSLMLDKNKTYTLYAIGHKESMPATLAGGIVSFPDTKRLQTLYFSTTFTPATTTTLSCMMHRAVGMFRVVFTDDIPTEVKKIAVTAKNVPSQWNFPQAAGISPTSEYNVTWTNWKRDTDGTTMFSIYILGSNEEQHYDITVSAYDADDNLLKAHAFPSVPIRNNWRIMYRGRFFLDTSFSSSFLLDEDWQEYDEVEY